MTDLLDDLEEISGRADLLRRQFDELADAEHKSRAADDTRQLNPFTECAPDCPVCATESEIGREWIQLGDKRRQILNELARETFKAREAHRARSRRPRSRGPSLTMRGLRAILAEFPNITAVKLAGLLEGQSRTYDEVDVELSLMGPDLAIRDLDTDEVNVIRSQNLNKYLRRARDS